MSKIEWTDATWNPIVGCSVVSPGCTNCYAMRMANRLERMAAQRPASDPTGRHYAGTTRVVNGNPVWTGHMAMAPEAIRLKPFRWKKPRTVFVNSMGDLFHEAVPDHWILQVFVVMAVCGQHTFQILTKRSARMRAWMAEPGRQGELAAAIRVNGIRLGWDDTTGDWPWPLPNVWLGVSAERQTEADARIPDLLASPAAVRFVSAEPLLGPVDLSAALTRGLGWVIVGGESGPGARPMHPDWARDLRNQCTSAGVPFCFKQWGLWGLADRDDGGAQIWLAEDGWHHAADWRDPPFQLRPAPRSWARMRLGSKAANGRRLDGREWSETP